LLFFRCVDNNLLIRDNQTGKLQPRFSNIGRAGWYIFSSDIIAGHYSHIGMIVALNNKPYIYEITEEGSYKNHSKFDIWTNKNVKNTTSLLDMSYILKNMAVMYIICLI